MYESIFKRMIIWCTTHGMIFINCNCVAAWWQWSIHLYTNRKNNYVHEEKQYIKQHKKHGTDKIESKTYETRKQNIQNTKTR